MIEGKCQRNSILQKQRQWNTELEKELELRVATEYHQGHQRTMPGTAVLHALPNFQKARVRSQATMSCKSDPLELQEA
jgi:hypothetical protein